MTLLQASGAATFDPARTFLMAAFHLSAEEIGRLDHGGVVSQTLDVKNRGEVATLGIVRIKTSPSKYVERLADITSFKRTVDVLQIGTFGVGGNSGTRISTAEMIRHDCQNGDHAGQELARAHASRSCRPS